MSNQYTVTGMTVREMFDAKWTPEPNTGCWLWVGTITGGGYGMFHSPSLKKMVMAHRWSWEAYRGPIPSGLRIDHMCRVRSCVNPDHLRVVSHRQNCVDNSLSVSAKNVVKTHCDHGHPFDSANTKICQDRGRETYRRRCRECARITGLQWYHRTKGAKRTTV
jgi:hypothetical protein